MTLGTPTLMQGASPMNQRFLCKSGPENLINELELELSHIIPHIESIMNDGLVLEKLKPNHASLNVLSCRLAYFFSNPWL